MNCVHCPESEQLLDLADALLSPRSALIILDGWPPELVSAAVLGMQLRRRPGLAFRALVEDWSIEDTIKELN